MNKEIIHINNLVSDNDIKKAMEKIKKRQHELREIRTKEFYNGIIHSLFKRFELLKNPELKKDGEYILSFEYDNKKWIFTITEREVRIKMSEDKYGQYTIQSTASNASSISFYNTTLSGLPEIIYNFAVYVTRNFSYELKNKPKEEEYEYESNLFE